MVKDAASSSPGSCTTVDGDRLAALERRHDALLRAHEELRRTLTKGVRRNLFRHGEESATLQEFANKSMATVAAWISSETCSEAIIVVSQMITLNVKVSNLISRCVYASFTAICVPLLLWLLRSRQRGSDTTVVGDQVQLIKLCLPMCFAWAFRDLAGALIMLKGAGHTWWPELLVAAGITCVIGFCEVLPCYRSSVEASHSGGRRDTLLARIAVMPGKLGLAVGFAWNKVLGYPRTELQSHVQTPLFKMMVQMLYFLLVTFAITTASLWWHRRSNAKTSCKDQAVRSECTVDERAADNSTAQLNGNGVSANIAPPAPAKPSQEALTEGKAVQLHSIAPGRLSVFKDVQAEFEHEVFTVAWMERELAHQTGQVLIDALCFVYAWAQLDAVNDLFFTYLLHCDGAKQCSYQANFAFACALTAVFTSLAKLLKSERRVSEWGQAAQNLTQKALSLNVGWAWSNFCYAAVEDATHSQTVGSTENRHLCTMMICAAFSWLAISVMHRKFETERRAWDRHVRTECAEQRFGFAFSAQL